jgi:hypothetical protein
MLQLFRKLKETGLAGSGLRQLVTDRDSLVPLDIYHSFFHDLVD